MKSDKTTIVIGAGPYGLSVAAHLKAQNVPMQIFGRPMDFWQKMSPKMYLKSSWSGLSIFDPAHKFSLGQYAKSIGISKREPVPLQLFLNYGQWFQQHVVPEVDKTFVRHVIQDNSRFHVELADGRMLEAERVVIAVGVEAFAHIPSFAHHLPPTLAAHSQDSTDFSRFKGKNVVVIGSGQSALESAALLHEAEADVELIARDEIRWISRKLYHYTGPLKRVFYPPSDVGPPGVNWLVANPLLYSRFSEKVRDMLDTRAVQPSGASWLRPRVVGSVKLTERTVVEDAQVQGETVNLRLSDGTKRTVDYIVLGTGYKVDINALTFLDPSLRQQISTYNGHPVLNEWFESSLPGIHFVGATAHYNFGPLCRFVVGAKVSAQQIAKHAAQGARQ